LLSEYDARQEGSEYDEKQRPVSQQETLPQGLLHFERRIKSLLEKSFYKPEDLS
jgi:hypothetical protein